MPTRLLVPILAIILLSATVFAQTTPAPSHVDVPTIDPRPDDVSTLDGIIAAYYDVISGPAGQPRQWSRDRTLYIPEIRFVSMSQSKEGKQIGRAHV